MSINRWVNFYRTNLYIEFGAALNIETDLLTWENYDYYQSTLTYLRDTFCCVSTPTNQQVDKYIANNEIIDDEDVGEFKILIDNLFVTYKVIYKITNKLNNIHIIKEKSRQEKSALKDRLREDRIAQAKQLKEDNQKFNNALVPCECGLEYIRYTKVNHFKSVEHTYRLDGVNWYKQQLFIGLIPKP